MLKRTANVSMIHRVSLAGMEYGIKENFGINSEQYHDSVVYHALIQAGVHVIRRVDNFKTKEPELSVNERINECTDREYYKLLHAIKGMLVKHTVNGKQTAEDTLLFTLSLFLTDLIYALQTDASMITVFPLPKIENYYGRISPHILSAVGNLLPQVTSTEVLTPIPQLSVKASEVAILEELIESNFFSAYSNAHSSLENIRESKLAILSDVSVKANSVWQKFSNTVDLKKLTITLMPITKNLADKVLTGLPGTVTNLVADILTKAALQEKRIVIYDYGRSHQALLTAHYEKLWRLQMGADN
jgi:hypothetical protein